MFFLPVLAMGAPGTVADKLAWFCTVNDDHLVRQTTRPSHCGRPMETLGERRTRRAGTTTTPPADVRDPGSDRRDVQADGSDDGADPDSTA
jgi:hypothetical protein